MTREEIARHIVMFAFEDLLYQLLEWQTENCLKLVLQTKP